MEQLAPGGDLGLAEVDEVMHVFGGVDPVFFARQQCFDEDQAVVGVELLAEGGERGREVGLAGVAGGSGGETTANFRTRCVHRREVPGVGTEPQMLDEHLLGFMALPTHSRYDGPDSADVPQAALHWNNQVNALRIQRCAAWGPSNTSVPDDER